MEEVQTITTLTNTDYSSSMDSRIEKLIDIPITTKITNNLIDLFNYLDIYAPHMNIVYSIVSVLRFLQLFGGAVMADDYHYFAPGTLNYKTMSIFSVLFHILPLDLRDDNEHYMLLAVSSFLLIMAIYLIFTAHHYSVKSEVPKTRIYIISIYMAIFPLLLLPVLAEFSGLLISQFSVKEISVIKIAAVALSLFTTIIYVLIFIKTYTTTLIFRSISFQTLEGAPQNKLIITTILITFLCAVTTELDKIPSIICIVVALLEYVYLISTVFNCGTFVSTRNQSLILGSSLFGIILCLGNICLIIFEFQFKEWYFAAFFGLGFVTIGLSSVFIKRRAKNDLVMLDEVESMRDIENIKTVGKFKQILITGFNSCHPVCMDFSIFKLAIDKWSTNLSVWAVYAKFASIYPELTNTIVFISSNVQMLKSKSSHIKIITAGIRNIVNTRETRFTPEIKKKISKITKKFMKTKNRLRNIWDLILQGATHDMSASIKSAYKSVEEAESDINYLATLYPNNRFAARQSAKFLYEIKGDIVGYKKKIDEINRLTRGLRVCPDVVHELGINAFPDIPEVSIETQTDNNPCSVNQFETESLNIDDISISDEASLNAYKSITQSIETHKIPEISFMYTSTIMHYIFLVLLPMLLLPIMFFIYSKELKDPIEYMQGIAFTRNFVNMMPAYVGKLLLQYMPDPDNPSEMILAPARLSSNFHFTSYGGKRNTRDICRYFATGIAESSAMVAPLRNFKYGNKHINKIRNEIFTTNLKFFFYRNVNDVEDSLASAIQISFMVASNVGKLVDYPVITPEVAKGSYSLNARNNNNLITTAFNNALTELVSYIQDNYVYYSKIFMMGLITLIVVNFLIFLMIYVMQVRKLKSNKVFIYKSLTELPKTVISNVSSTFNKIKSEAVSTKSENGSRNDMELSRQEESIIKLFSSISDGDQSSGEIFALFMFALIFIFSCITFYFSAHCFTAASETVYYNCHHINYLYGSITFLFSIYSRLWKIVLEKAHPSFAGSCANVTDEANNIDRIIGIQSSYFLAIRFGGSDQREVPFEGMKAAVKAANQFLSCQTTEPPTDMIDSVHCFTSTQQLYFITSYLKRISSAMHENPPRWPTPNGDGVGETWQMGPVELYEVFFYPTGTKLVPTMIENINEEGMKIVRVAIIFAVLTLICVVTIIMAIRMEEKLMRFTMKQLLRCPANVILENNKLMQLISGQYSKEEEINADKYAWFTNEVINKLDEVVIVCQDETGKIISVNNTFENMFGIEYKEIENKSIKEFFTPERFLCDVKLDRVFLHPTIVKFKKANGEKVYLEFSNTTISGNRIYSGRNITQNLMHEKLIRDEKYKSDKMLASILPPNLVARVQAGEKNISFSVQSATILFLDVVEFTPWCGSHDAQYVMRMLNIMFKEFDAITNAHKTMTKIKCIGDCYMAAGGIFDEINQPAVHAKEAVDFGCLVIKKLFEIDQQENEKLRIRVGVNTGGPIVAGVIGVEKPTFEILGPAISIAHEMEHHGVPMKVHISRPVYELIYGQQFDIKERGEIDVKGGKMFTYLVEP